MMLPWKIELPPDDTLLDELGALDMVFNFLQGLLLKSNVHFQQESHSNFFETLTNCYANSCVKCSRGEICYGKCIDS